MPSLTLLSIGLLPLAYVIWLVIRFGFAEALSLRCAGVVSSWIGYQLSPWMYYLTGEKWDKFLLVPRYIDTGLLFATIANVLFLVGYSRAFGRQLARLRGRSKTAQQIAIKPKFVLALSALVLLAGIISVRGVDNYWSATLSRGAGQFDERDAVGSLIQVVSVLQLPLTIALTISSTLLILQRRPTRYGVALGITGLLVASLHEVYFFSRTAGYPLVIFAFLALRIRGLRAIFLATTATLIALFMGSVGLNYRAAYYPGIRNYIEAAATSIAQTVDVTESSRVSKPFINPFDALAPFTRVVAASRGQDQQSSLLALKLLWNLNPLPSELLPQFEIGQDLAIVMGTWGSTGITTPAFAQLYLVGGYFGSIGMLFVGLTCGWFEKRSILRPSALTLLNVILLFSGFPIGLHNSVRAMTRPFVYGLALTLVARAGHMRRRLVSGEPLGEQQPQVHSRGGP